jgi:hypothetical protein
MTMARGSGFLAEKRQQRTTLYINIFLLPLKAFQDLPPLDVTAPMGHSVKFHLHIDA